MFFLCKSTTITFANVDNMNSSISSNSSLEDDLCDLNNVWYNFDVMADKHRANMKIGHINANSIAGFKFLEIKNWLLCGKFDMLIISETKIDETFPDSHFHIDGFRMCRVDRKLGGGGLMAFVRSDVCFSVIKQFKNISADELLTFRTESLILKVKVKQTWIAVVGIYRPPCIPKYKWKYELSILFEAVTEITNDVYILGDFNCDLIHPNKPPMDGRDLNDLLDIYNLANLINSPTRIDKTSETLLDIILTNSKAKVFTSGVIDVQISDHSLVYTILRSSAPRTRSRQIVTTVFESLYMDVVNKHAPLKHVHLRANQVPFMTKQWRQEIRYRNRLWKKYLKERTDENYCKYKTQRNVCTRLRRKAIKDFFRKKNEENSPREFWNVYRPFLHSKSKQANDIFIKENDVVINQKKDIAEIFNNYFVNIADDLVDKSLQYDYAADFNDHPSVQSVINTTKEGIFNFSLKCINELEICQILANINTRKSCGHDFLHPRIVKESAAVIAQPLACIFNESIKQCKYPTVWKMGQVTPSFKKGNEHSYADDCQIYDSHMEPNELDKLIQNYVTSVNQWFRINGMISNPSKHQAMVLGNKLHHRFSFPTKDSLELFGMTIDQDLNFDKQLLIFVRKLMINLM